MNKDLVAIFEYLEREKGIKRELVVAAITESLEAAARKSVHGASNVTVQINSKTGIIEVLCEKEVVEKVANPVCEISIKEYAEIDPHAEIGQLVTVVVTPRDFGRIAAQKARQVLSQKLKGAERDVIYEEYRDRCGQLISGTVKRVGRAQTVIVDLGKVEGVLPRRNVAMTEKFQVGDRVLALLLEVRDTESGGAEVVLSRTDPEFVKQLFEQEVTEIADGTVMIEKLVREPGYRTKMIVRSNDGRVDPVGACIGMRGVRIKNIIRELHNEKIDIIAYATDLFDMLQQALSPVEMKKIRASEDNAQVLVVVDDEVFGTAIGKKGSNARLTSQLLDVEHFEVQKVSDFYRLDALERLELAATDDARLDEVIDTIEGVSHLVVGQLVADERYNTPRKLLQASLEELTQVPGISLEQADKLLEHIRKQVLARVP